MQLEMLGLSDEELSDQDVVQVPVAMLSVEQVSYQDSMS